MKKSLLVVCTLLVAFLTACTEDEVAKKYAVTVTVSAPVAISELTDLTVVAVNEAAEETKSVLKGDTASFKLVAGTYTFRATASNDTYSFMASAANTVVSADAEISLSMDASIKQESGLIFKEVYYTGTKSYYWKDGFYEIFNNGNETQYLDGVILGLVDNKYGEDSPWKVDGKLPDYYPLSNITVYFPGTGKDYPLEPGKSVVLATLAIDHSTRELTENDSKSPVDLSKADWDIYIPTQASDIDNPDVPNMLVAYSVFGLDFMPATSGQSMILAKLPAGMSVEEFAADANNIKQYEGGWFKNLCIPSEYVIDAIDIAYMNGGKVYYKTILDKDDAGLTWVSGSNTDLEVEPNYSSKSLRRKCALVTPTRVYYQDTNNSTNDFIKGGQVPTPGVHPTVAD